MADEKKLKQIQKLLDAAEGNLASARNLMSEITGVNSKAGANLKDVAKDLSILNDGKTIEGVFDGEQMVAPDNKKYPVPANYASKSKLVEGDVLKLTISDDGGLTYKQINPVERKNIIGTLSYENGNYSVLAEGKDYKVLFASVTYYKGKPGNKASIVLPAKGECTWAAVESIIHDHGEAPKEKEVDKKEEEPHVKIPEENVEILEEVEEEFDPGKKKEVKGKKEEEEKGGLKVLPKIEVEKSDDEKTPTKEIEANETTDAEEEKKEPESKKLDEAESKDADAPKIQKQAAMPDDEKAVNEETDANSLGEETPKQPGAAITELEI